MAHGGREGVGQVCAGIPGISKLLPAVPDWCVQGVFLHLAVKVKNFAVPSNSTEFVQSKC